MYKCVGQRLITDILRSITNRPSPVWWRITDWVYWTKNSWESKARCQVLCHKGTFWRLSNQVGSKSARGSSRGTWINKMKDIFESLPKTSMGLKTQNSSQEIHSIEVFADYIEMAINKKTTGSLFWKWPSLSPSIIFYIIFVTSSWHEVCLENWKNKDYTCIM